MTRDDIEALAARLTAEVEAMVPALSYYADQLCEGWCEGCGEWAKFEDCGGCKARSTLFALGRSLSGEPG